MKILVALVVSALLASASTPELPDGQDAWRDACNLSGYSCFGLRRPYIARAPLPGLYGRYHMGDMYILVDENISGKLAYGVTVHEMVHYLQYKRGAWTFTPENRCQMERDAFVVSNMVFRRLGDTADMVDWNVYRLGYGCAL